MAFPGSRKKQPTSDFDSYGDPHYEKYCLDNAVQKQARIRVRHEQRKENLEELLQRIRDAQADCDAKVKTFEDSEGDHATRAALWEEVADAKCALRDLEEEAEAVNEHWTRFFELPENRLSGFEESMLRGLDARREENHRLAQMRDDQSNRVVRERMWNYHDGLEEEWDLAGTMTLTQPSEKPPEMMAETERRKEIAREYRESVARRKERMAHRGLPPVSVSKVVSMGSGKPIDVKQRATVHKTPPTVDGLVAGAPSETGAMLGYIGTLNTEAMSLAAGLSQQHAKNHLLASLHLIDGIFRPKKKKSKKSSTTPRALNATTTTVGEEQEDEGTAPPEETNRTRSPSVVQENTEETAPAEEQQQSPEQPEEEQKEAEPSSAPDPDPEGEDARPSTSVSQAQSESETVTAAQREALMLQATAFANLAILERQANSPISALAAMERSLAIEEALGVHSAVSALNLSIMLTWVKRHEEALLAARRSLKLAATTDDLQENVHLLITQNLTRCQETMSGEVYDEMLMRMASKDIGERHPTAQELSRQAKDRQEVERQAAQRGRRRSTINPENSILGKRGSVAATANRSVKLQL